MTYHFNVEGPERKAMAQKISEITGEPAVYLRVPTCAYQIGKFNLSKAGELTWGDMDEADPDFMDLRCSLMAALEEAGYHSEETAFYEAQLAAMGETYEEPEESSETPETPAETADFDGLSISMPREKFTETAIGNLKALIEAKASLIKRAFQAQALPLRIDAEKITFPWFPVEGPEETAAYTTFIQKLSEMAIAQKRVTAKEKEIVNEKYEFRCFLLRLGMIGDEYKQTRKILMKNLSGSAAFKSGQKKGGEQA